MIILNIYGYYVFFIVPINVIFGSNISDYFVKKYNVLPESKIDVYEKGIQKKNFQDKVKYYGVLLTLIPTFFLSVPCYILMEYYNEKYHYQNYPTYGFLTIQDKSIYKNRGTSTFKINGKLTYEDNTKEGVTIKIEEPKYNSLKIGDKVKVVFSYKDLSFIKLVE